MNKLESIFFATCGIIAILVAIWYYGYQKGRDQEYMIRRAARREAMLAHRLRQQVNQVKHEPVTNPEEIAGLRQQGVECSICLEGFDAAADNDSDAVAARLECGHHFHRGCIGPWLRQSGTCPLCRDAGNNGEGVESANPLCRYCGASFVRQGTSDQPGYYFCERCSTGGGGLRGIMIVN